MLVSSVILYLSKLSSQTYTRETCLIELIKALSAALPQNPSLSTVSRCQKNNDNI